MSHGVWETVPCGDELLKVALQVRGLAKAHAFLREELRRQFACFVDQCVRRERQQAALLPRYHARAIELLRLHLLREPDLGSRASVEVTVRAMLPVALADIAHKYWHNGLSPAEKSQIFDHLIEACQRDLRFKFGGVSEAEQRATNAHLSELEAQGTHKPLEWTVSVAPLPDDGPVRDPFRLEAAVLRELPPEEYHTRVFFWLGRLADFGNQRPIVPLATVPDGDVHSVEQAAALDAWHVIENRFTKSAKTLPSPDDGRQMLEYAEQWVRDRASELNLAESATHDTADAAAAGALTMPQGGPSDLAEQIGSSVESPAAGNAKQQRNENPDSPGIEVPRFAHADDFTWIVFAGQHYNFTKGNQSEAIRALWGSWEKGGRRDGCGLSEKTIGEKCGTSSDSFRLAHVFRGHAAFTTIIRTVSKGVFALFAESQENPIS